MAENSRFILELQCCYDQQRLTVSLKGTLMSLSVTIELLSNDYRHANPLGSKCSSLDNRAAGQKGRGYGQDNQTFRGGRRYPPKSLVNPARCKGRVGICWCRIHRVAHRSTRYSSRSITTQSRLAKAPIRMRIHLYGETHTSGWPELNPPARLRVGRR